MAITTATSMVRLEIGDTDVTNPQYADDEIQYFLDKNAGNVMQAAADAADALAVKFAAGIDFNTDTLAVKKLQRSEQMSKRATEIRERAEGGLHEMDQIKVDGYSQDIDNTDTSLIQGMPVDPDIPRYGPSWSSDLARQNPSDYVPGQ